VSQETGKRRESREIAKDLACCFPLNFGSQQPNTPNGPRASGSHRRPRASRAGDTTDGREQGLVLNLGDILRHNPVPEATLDVNGTSNQVTDR
jgi:hypothetical protein